MPYVSATHAWHFVCPRASLYVPMSQSWHPVSSPHRPRSLNFGAGVKERKYAKTREAGEEKRRRFQKLVKYMPCTHYWYFRRDRKKTTEKTKTLNNAPRVTSGALIIGCRSKHAEIALCSAAFRHVACRARGALHVCHVQKLSSDAGLAEGQSGITTRESVWTCLA